MNRVKEVFEILKKPCYRTSPIVTRGSKRGPNPWQQHHLKARKEKEPFLQSGTNSKMMRPTGNLSLLITGRTHGSGTWTTSCTSTSTAMHRPGTEKICESASLTKCWRKQIGTTSMAETRVPGRKKETLKSTKVRKRIVSSLYRSSRQEAFAEQN